MASKGPSVVAIAKDIYNEYSLRAHAALNWAVSGSHQKER